MLAAPSKVGGFDGRPEQQQGHYLGFRVCWEGDCQLNLAYESLIKRIIKRDPLNAVQYRYMKTIKYIRFQDSWLREKCEVLQADHGSPACNCNLLNWLLKMWNFYSVLYSVMHLPQPQKQNTCLWLTFETVLPHSTITCKTQRNPRQDGRASPLC